VAEISSGSKRVTVMGEPRRYDSKAGKMASLRVQYMAVVEVSVPAEFIDAQGCVKGDVFNYEFETRQGRNGAYEVCTNFEKQGGTVHAGANGSNGVASPVAAKV
jgi:hypothetical protein